MTERWELLQRIELGAMQLRSTFPALARSQYVAGEGPDEPRAFVVGEAPGAEEDMRGRPFIGPAGMALRQLMRLGGLEPALCWVTNALKFRPPGNRKPMVPEIKAFRPLLMNEWRAVGRPMLIIPVGGTAYEAVTGKHGAISNAAGKPFRMTSGVTVYPMIHPSYGLRGNDKAKERLEHDWEQFGKWFAERH
jgi:uracil-DNA glycosylase family 4